MEEIEDEFLKKFEITEYENRSLSKENLILFGGKVRQETPTTMQATLPLDLQIGFNNFTIPLKQIK